MGGGRGPAPQSRPSARGSRVGRSPRRSPPSRATVDRVGGRRRPEVDRNAPLAEFSARNSPLSPSRTLVPWARYGSPPGGTSSLTTSAPSAARSAVACDPATNRRRSRARGPRPSGSTHHGCGSRNSPKQSRITSDDLAERRARPGGVHDRRHALRPSRSTPRNRPEGVAAPAPRPHGEGSRADGSVEALDVGVEDERLGELHRNLVGVACTLTPTATVTVADGRSIRYADSAIQRCGTPGRCRRAHRRASIWSSSSLARDSSSSVRYSTKYEPASGSTVRGTPVSCATICWVRSASCTDSSLGIWQRLVVAHDVDRLRAAEHRAPGIARGADEVVQRLLRGQRRTGVAGEEPQPAGVRVLRAEALGRDRFHIRRAARSLQASSKKSSWWRSGRRAVGRSVERDAARDQNRSSTRSRTRS